MVSKITREELKRLIERDEYVIIEDRKLLDKMYPGFCPLRVYGPYVRLKPYIYGYHIFTSLENIPNDVNAFLLVDDEEVLY